MKVRFEEVRDIKEVETEVGVVRELENRVVVNNSDFELSIKKDDDSYEVSLNIVHWRIGHDHDDMIYIHIDGIPAETEEPNVYTGEGTYKVVRKVRVRVMGDLVDVEKVKEGDWKTFYEE